MRIATVGLAVSVLVLGAVWATSARSAPPPQKAASSVRAKVLRQRASSEQWDTLGEALVKPGESKIIGSPPNPVIGVLGIENGAVFTHRPSGLNAKLTVSGTSSIQCPLTGSYAGQDMIMVSTP